ncbi:hypothetical protein MAPG_10451 [Magnaporthiopsis poae ATCC 64411]|uniref:RING-type domain-containing protein n=1 Tax=Magnaporthiopsis poae (strain ATCC 64411 / 73-15) TaxID=644358 RepID=A0A0C4ECM0_MAGP6|nr:hypothetical protein MAPG_10451 [Magnaporthiopsis poae ATCC 64411]
MDADAESLGRAQTRLIAAYANFEKRLSSVIDAAFNMPKFPTLTAELMKMAESLAPGSPAQTAMSRMIFAVATSDVASLVMPGSNHLRCLAREVPQWSTGDDEEQAAAANPSFRRGDLASTAQDALFAGGDWDSSWAPVLRGVFRLRGDEEARYAQTEFDRLERQAETAAADVLEAAKAVLRCERPSVREETCYYPELASWIHDRTSVLPPRVTCPVCLVSRVSVPPLDDLAAAATGAADGDGKGGGDEEVPEKGVLLPCKTIVCEGCWKQIRHSPGATYGTIGKCPVCRAYVDETMDLNEQLGKEFNILGSAP